MTTNTNVIVKSRGNLPILVDDNSLFSYLEKIKKFPVLTEEEEHSLLVAFKNNGDVNAAHTLVTSHLRLAAKIAFGYRKYGLPMSDIISEANIGLMQAVKKFDLTKEVRLSTYAIWWIKAQINDFILKSWSLVKIGTVAAQKKLFYNLNRIKNRLGIYENKELSPEVVHQIATELDVEKSEVIEMNRRLAGDKSLNVVVGDDSENEKIDFLVDDRTNQEERVELLQEKENRQKLLKNAIDKLNKREQYIIINRRLMENPSTLEAIGAKFDISRERVRQIEKRALEKLAEILTGRTLSDK